MFIPLRIKLDIVEQYLINTGYTLVRNDYNSCDLIVEVREQGELFDDLSGYSATIVVSRADDVIVNDFMVVTDTLSIKLPNSMYAVEGEVRADISLYKDGAKKTLQPFSFKVREDIDIDRVIEGDNRIGVLDSLIDETLSASYLAEYEAGRAKAVSDVLNEKISVDYYRGLPGYTPVKDVDYFDGADGYTPVKGTDYFDGEKGDTGLIATYAHYSVTDLITGVSAELKIQPLAPSRALSRYAVLLDNQDISGKLSISEAFTTVPITFESDRVSIAFYDERNYNTPGAQPTVITKLVKTESNVFFELGALVVQNEEDI